MGINMKAKLDKYWGVIEKMNFLIFFANILDPTSKLEYLEFSLLQMYGDSSGSRLYQLVKASLFELYEDYNRLYGSNVPTGSECQSQSTSEKH